MYVTGNPKSKAEIKRGLAEGKKYKVYDPGVGLAPVIENGEVDIEGPHYPKPHMWYGVATLVNGVIVTIK